MKNEWALHTGSPDAAEVARATLDVMEFLDGLRKEKRLNREFSRGFGKLAYHAACHLRAQKIAYPAARLLALLPETEVRMVERCSAVDGTWGMKAEYYDEGARYARRLATAVGEVLDDGAQVVVGDCNLAGLRIQKENGAVVLHPVQLLCEAYGLETFSELGAEA
jgi:glycerol-3-phosphate dehydrogenase subunit C